MRSLLNIFGIVIVLGLIYFGITLGYPVWAITLALIIAPGAVGLIIAIIGAVPVAAEASARGLDVTPIDIVKWRMRGVDPGRIVRALVRLDEEAMTVQARELIDLARAGANIEDVVECYIALMRIQMGTSMHEIAAFQLAGADIVSAAHAVVAAEREGEELPFNEACAMYSATMEPGPATKPDQLAVEMANEDPNR